MSKIIDVDDVVNRMSLALREIPGAELPLLSQYAQAKARAVTAYAGLIADAYLAGALDEADMKREMGEIEQMSQRFTRNLRGFAGVQAEQASRAILGVLLGQMRAGLSFAGAPLPQDLSAPQAN